MNVRRQNTCHSYDKTSQYKKVGEALLDYFGVKINDKIISVMSYYELLDTWKKLSQLLQVPLT